MLGFFSLQQCVLGPYRCCLAANLQLFPMAPFSSVLYYERLDGVTAFIDVAGYIYAPLALNTVKSLYRQNCFFMHQAIKALCK